jgi:hypothetical protein
MGFSEFPQQPAVVRCSPVLEGTLHLPHNDPFSKARGYSEEAGVRARRSIVPIDQGRRHPASSSRDAQVALLELLAGLITKPERDPECL